MSDDCLFPPRPITPDVIQEYANLGWQMGLCCICGSQAIVRQPDQAIFCVCCPVCQRFTVSFSGASDIKGYRKAHPNDEDKLLAGLSRYCSQSDAPVHLRQNTWQWLAAEGARGLSPGLSPP